MPEISRFFGIVVQMYYAIMIRHISTSGMPGKELFLAIEPLAVLRGSLSPRALALVTEWAALHRAELLEDWALAREEEQLNPIAPLE